ncbi:MULTISPECIES: hypothetical protein [Parachlamydia]|jgi:hypothetical protein|uniref:Outer membrane protein beta-barrel domain-containing protein n=2 Tax=Parachlamydia acanthamoebae TaxID=83552 RepID=F8KXX5_PARAV|nr:hypothetical protein [Parachlamydia acanthamoebae]EFB40411.1 hypothetical protein pah_c205o049 [Parachlamydia acanthamoebae str. Hall's coccus]KIA78535.1 hypothetical protein DB43_DU00020 [Parachlamydia acanthamoebae]CCB85705.1 putative uncharacterized protein [Parachlamydia acanthamoebae UV-7]
MKFKSTIYASFLFLTILFTSTQSLSAFDYDFGCCDYGTPYDECKWSVSINGGVSPTWFQRKGRDLYFNHLGPFFEVPESFKTPKFCKIFDLPWNVGIELGYMFCDRLEVFADFDYTQACGKRHHHRRSDISASSRERVSQYRAFDFYLGTRYYLCPIFCSFTPFFGGKVGLITRDKIRGSTRTTVTGGSSGFGHRHTRFKSDTTISGGLHAGVNWDLSSCLSVTVKAEAIWSGDWRPTNADEGEGSSVINPALPVPLIIHGKTGPVLSVPVTLGLRYAF